MRMQWPCPKWGEVAAGRSWGVCVPPSAESPWSPPRAHCRPIPVVSVIQFVSIRQCPRAPSGVPFHTQPLPLLKWPPALEPAMARTLYTHTSLRRAVTELREERHSWVSHVMSLMTIPGGRPKSGCRSQECGGASWEPLPTLSLTSWPPVGSVGPRR